MSDQRTDPPAEQPTPAEPSEQVDPLAPVDASEHDPTGLDLAHSVASELRTANPTQPRRRPRSPSVRSAGPVRSGPGPDDRDPAPLGSTVERLVRESGWSTDVSVHTVLGRWPQIVGAEVAAHCEPVGYHDGVVDVQTDSTSWATQLRLLAGTMVARLNAELGDGTVVRIQVSGPSAPSWKRGRRSVRDGRGPRDTYG